PAPRGEPARRARRRRARPQPPGGDRREPAEPRHAGGAVMSIEFIGHVFPHEFSETIAASGPVVQPDYLRALARAHEAAGFDKVLIPPSSSMADGFIFSFNETATTE